MGLRDLFLKSRSPVLARLPAGSFTVDADGQTVASTLPQSVSRALLRQIASIVLESFRTAHRSALPLNELAVEFAAFKLTARELRGGAIIFLTPRVTGSSNGRGYAQ